MAVKFAQFTQVKEFVSHHPPTVVRFTGTQLQQLTQPVVEDKDQQDALEHNYVCVSTKYKRNFHGVPKIEDVFVTAQMPVVSPLLSTDLDRCSEYVSETGNDEDAVPRTFLGPLHIEELGFTASKKRKVFA